jgi:hypothetical protein
VFSSEDEVTVLQAHIVEEPQPRLMSSKMISCGRKPHEKPLGRNELGFLQTEAHGDVDVVVQQRRKVSMPDEAVGTMG